MGQKGRVAAAGSLLYKGLASDQGGVRMPEPLPASPATASAAKSLHVLGGQGIEAIVQVGSQWIEMETCVWFSAQLLYSASW